MSTHSYDNGRIGGYKINFIWNKLKSIIDTD